MSDIFPSIDDSYPILSMLCGENIISTEVNGKRLNIEENCDNHFSVELNANELRMLADEFLRIAEILEKKKDE